MDIHSRNEYFRELQGRYFMAKLEKERFSILGEYYTHTHQNR